METTVKQAAQRGLSRTTVGIIFVVVGVAFQWWERDPSWPVIVGLIVMGGSDVVVAIAQASYAFAPAMFGIILASSQSAARGIGGGVTAFFLCVAAVQAIAIASFLAGRRR